MDQRPSSAGRTPYRHPRRSRRSLLEARAPFEYAHLIAARPLLRSAPTGDGGPVLVLPGLAASDRSTGPLRSYLRDQGHYAHGWRLGRNPGPTPEIIDGVAARLVAVHDRHEGRPVSIVGWSLGGLFAVALARIAPGLVRRVITLGSPLAALDDPAADRVELRERILAVTGTVAGPPPPLTSLWSRTDAIVPWQTSIVGNGTRPGDREDIEVVASHLGIGWNPAALYAIADRLALPDRTLPPFQPPRRLGLMYPPPLRRSPTT